MGLTTSTLFLRYTKKKTKMAFTRNLNITIKDGTNTHELDVFVAAKVSQLKEQVAEATGRAAGSFELAFVKKAGGANGSGGYAPEELVLLFKDKGDSQNTKLEMERLSKFWRNQALCTLASGG